MMSNSGSGLRSEFGHKGALASAGDPHDRNEDIARSVRESVSDGQQTDL